MFLDISVEKPDTTSAHVEACGDPQQDQDENASHYGSSVGWLNDPNEAVHRWDSDSSNDYIVMSIKLRKEDC